jgi:hypothetical protein
VYLNLMRTCVVPWAFDIGLEINCIHGLAFIGGEMGANAAKYTYKRGIDGARDESSVIISL